MSEITLTSNQATTITESSQSLKKVALIEDLLNGFHSYEINYCHWKSNEHLGASMTADTDLDILFDENQKDELEVLLQKFGFKKFESIRQKKYRDIVDFIGMDLQSGKVVHLHTHYRLTLGEPYLKSYQLNLHKKILEGRVWDDEFTIYRTDPNMELILLYIREALKIRNRDLIRMFFKDKVQYSTNLLNEFNWLKHRCSVEEIETILKGIFTNYLPVYSIVISEFNRTTVLKLSSLIRKEFKKYRQCSRLGAISKRWYREITVKVYRKSSLLLNRPILSHRINPRGGLVIAVVGADGSGKSTVTANLIRTFGKKLDVYKIYFGRGAGRVSLPRRILFKIKHLVTGERSGRQGIVSGKIVSGTKRGFLANVYKGIEALIVANEKRNNLKLMQIAKNKGMLVICDRFPQNQVMSFNDGPLLNHLSGSANSFIRAIAKIEARVYAMAENNPPDLLIKLVCDADVVAARKPGEHSLEILEGKIAGFKSLKVSKECKAISIDASLPLEEVLRNIKKEIWTSYL